MYFVQTDSTNGQIILTVAAMASETTRRALLVAAGELIAENGWHSVSTRAIATRAGQPHGTVSYHFTGKADLLRQAGVAAIDEFFRQMTDVVEGGGLSVPGLITETGHQLATLPAQHTSAEFALLAECLVQACRDAELREQLLQRLRQYREALTQLATRDHDAGTLQPGVDPRGLAILVAAAVDGLALHRVVDDELDVERACTMLARLVAVIG